MYTSDDVIAGTEIELQNFKVPSIMKPNQHVEAHYLKVLRCNQEYTGYTFNGLFVESLTESNHSSKRFIENPVDHRRTMIWRDILFHSGLLTDTRFVVLPVA